MSHEYMLRADKDVYESLRPSYVIEISTNNYRCYKEILSAASDIIEHYQDAENTTEELSKYENE